MLSLIQLWIHSWRSKISSFRLNWNYWAADMTFVKTALGSRIQKAMIHFLSFSGGLILSGFMLYADRGFAIISPLSLIFCFPWLSRTAWWASDWLTGPLEVFNLYLLSEMIEILSLSEISLISQVFLSTFATHDALSCSKAAAISVGSPQVQNF